MEERIHNTSDGTTTGEIKLTNAVAQHIAEEIDAEIFWSTMPTIQQMELFDEQPRV